jgi:PTH1 family peptidyl-tRNA hydrolase
MAETMLIIGLGNPGREYRETRHNIGFMLLDRLAVKLGSRFSRFQAKAVVATGMVGDKKWILAKPQTYMNLSGHSVQSLVRFHKVPLDNLIVVHDDIDLPIGIIRIRPDGGSAGQKGIASIIERLGTDKFIRIRIGIGRPPGQLQAAYYVLEKFTKAETEIVSQTLDRVVDATLEISLKGLDGAMNKFNGNQAVI